MKLAVVILNWNGRKHLEKFLPSVIKYSSVPEVEIVVADNGSTDESLIFLKEHFPYITIILLQKNYGFAEGYNRALKQINATYYVLLNSDIELTENWFAPVLEYMDLNTEVAACMPKILSYNNKSQFEYAGAAGGFIDYFGYPFCRGRILDTIEDDKGQYNTNKDIFWATGACLFVRAELYHKVNGLDDDFFAHMEEIDLCWRLKNRGYKIAYVANATVYHLGGGTLSNDNPHKLYLNYRNNLMLLFKNLPSERFYQTLIVRMLLDGASAMVYLLSFSFASFGAVFKSHLSFYMSVRKLIGKRKALSEGLVKTTHSETYNRSIVFDYFFKKKKRFNDLKF